MTSSSRAVIMTIVGLVFVFFLYLSAPTAEFHPKGILLPGKNTYEPGKPSDVQLVSRVSFPYKVVGHVNVQMQYQVSSEKKDAESVIKKAQQLAAEVGANAILVTHYTLWHPQPDRLPFNQVHWIFRARAIKTTKSLLPLAPGIVMPSNSTN